MEERDSGMAVPILDRAEKLRRVSGAYYTLSAWMARVVTALALITVLVALTAPLRDAIGIWTPVLLTFFVYLSVIFKHGSESLKGTADSIQRRVEIEDGLGRPTPTREYAELVYESPILIQKLMQRTKSKGSYWASKEKAGPLRLVQNVRESAWWTKQLSGEMVWYEGGRLLLLLIVALVLYRAATMDETRAVLGSNMSEVVTAALVFFLTQGPFARLVGFRKFRDASERVVERAERILSGCETISEAVAVDLASSYQIARKGSPRIPSWWWSVRRTSLNATWEKITREEIELQKPDREQLAM